LIPACLPQWLVFGLLAICRTRQKSRRAAAPPLRPDTAPVADFGGMAGIRPERAFIQ